MKKKINIDIPRKGLIQLQLEIKEQKKWGKIIFEETATKNFPKLINDIYPQIKL